MARDKASKAKRSEQSAPPPQVPVKTTNAKGKSKSAVGISDALRHAVKDLGGDEEDLELIAGVDSDDDDSPKQSGSAVASSSKSSEKEIKKALGEFIKGLDFKAAGAHAPAESDGEEEGDEDEDEDEDVDAEAEEEEEEQSIAPGKAQPIPSSKPLPPAAPIAPSSLAPAPSASDPEATSATTVPPTPSWPDLLPPLAPSPNLAPLPPFKLQGLRSKAESFLRDLPPLNRKSSSADAAFISQVLNSGTHQDKLAALTLLIRESPIHAVKELNRLKAMTGYKEASEGGAGGAEGARVGAGAGGNKDQRVAVCKALVDWWVSGGGKSTAYNWRYFADQPLLGHPDLTDRHLLVFAFEDFLKRWFFNLLQVLEVLAHDPLVYIRTQALQMVFRLLQGNAEQEQNLLRLGANKLGDTDKSVASKTSHLLLSLLQVHPAMKAIVAREVSSLVLKPSAPTASTSAAASSSHIKFDDEAPSASKSHANHQGKGNRKGKAAERSEGQSHARYYGLITLNQITLARSDQDLAGKLVDLYFEIFREILGEDAVGGKAEEDGGGDEGGRDIENVVGKVKKWEGRRKQGGKHSKNGKGKGKGKEVAEEELVDGGDTRLIAAVLTGINRAVPYARLDDAVFKGYMQSLFRITHLGTFNTSIQSLSLIFQITQSTQSTQSTKSESHNSGSGTSSSTENTSVIDRFYRTLYDSLFDSRLFTSSKQAMYLNLLFRALKADREIKRVMAFVKRLCQMFGLAGVPFLSGALYLLGEMFSTTPGLKRMLIEPEDDGEERFVDAPENGSSADEQDKESEAEAEEVPKAPLADAYDGKKREPLYAKAETSCLWEIMSLTNHYHPSISLLSSQLLLSQPLSGSPDIGQNTLISFLDKFVYRNPKKNIAQKGASVMQPAAASGDRSGVNVRMQKGVMGVTGAGGAGVNSEAFWRKKVENVPADQLFFHKFFSAKLAQKDQEKRRKKGKDTSELGDRDDNEESEAEKGGEGSDDEAAEAGSELDEDEVWKAMQASMPGADDLGISDSDEEDDDVDYSSDEDEEEGDDAGDDDDDDEEEDGDSGSEDELNDPGLAESDEEVDVDDDSDDAELAEEDDEEVSSAAEDDDEDEEDGDFPNLDSEEEDLIPLDELDAMPDIALEASPSPEPEPELDAGVKGKRKRDSNKERKERKKKRKELPLFGDYEEWQKVIEEGGNEGED